LWLGPHFNFYGAGVVVGFDVYGVDVGPVDVLARDFISLTLEGGLVHPGPGLDVEPGFAGQGLTGCLNLALVLAQANPGTRARNFSELSARGLSGGLAVNVHGEWGPFSLVTHLCVRG